MSDSLEVLRGMFDFAVRAHGVATRMHEEALLMRTEVRLVWAELQANQAAGWNSPEPLTVLLEAAITFTNADMGNIQLVDPVSGALRIQAQFGFGSAFLNFFESVHGGRTACGTALRRAERVVIEDVTKSPIFRGTHALDVLLDARVRAVQSTPLIGPAGCVLGVLSTHYERAKRPTPRELGLLDALSHRALSLTAPRTPHLHPSS